MKRRIYIIPGYGESHKRQKSYAKVANLFGQADFIPIHVNIDWKYGKPAEFGNYTQQFLSQFKKEKGTKTYVLGFSYGATIALLTATKTHPAHLILCSLSPYFTEDRKNLKPAWLRFWEKTFANSDYTFREIASKVKTQTTILVGSEEHSSVLYRARSAKRRLENSRMITAMGAKHSIGQKEYLAALERSISILN